MAQRTILVTGASSGIGWAAARDLPARGWHVLATARRSEDRERLAALAGVVPLHLEMADPASVSACVAEALERAGGRIDAVFANAAYGQPGAVEDLPTTALRHQLEVNVIGTHALVRDLIPQMRARGAGRIVLCSSVLGFMAAPYRGAYCASKFALEALGDCLRLELAGTGLHVVLIEPGPIATRFIDNAVAAARASIDLEGSPHRARYATMLAALEAGGKMRFKLPPEAVVAKLVAALDSPRPKARYRVTWPTHAAHLLKRFLPTRLMDRVAAQS